MCKTIKSCYRLVCSKLIGSRHNNFFLLFYYFTFACVIAEMFGINTVYSNGSSAKHKKQ